MSRLDRTSITYFGQDTGESRSALVERSSSLTITTYNFNDNPVTRMLSNRMGARVIASNRATTQFGPNDNDNAEGFKKFGTTRNFREADLAPFGSKLHAKIGIAVEKGTNRKLAFVGTANLTQNAMAATEKKGQHNYYVLTADKSLVQQTEKVLGQIVRNEAPTSTENLLVTSKADLNTAVERLTAVINDKSNRSDLYIASPTLTDDRMIEAILSKARRGDNVYVGLGGVDETDRKITMQTYRRLVNQHPELRGKLHVAMGERPWHDNVMAMGDVFAEGSHRYSTSALQGHLNGNLQTNVTLLWRDKTIAEDIRKHIRENGFDSRKDFRGNTMAWDEIKQFDRERYGIFMHALMPERGMAGRTWAYQLDPTIVFDRNFRKAATALALRESGEVGDPTKMPGRLYRYIYTQAVIAGGQTGPIAIPESIVQADRLSVMPAIADELHGKIGAVADKWFGEDVSAAITTLLQPRGNRSILGSILVNIGAYLDRKKFAEHAEQVRNSPFYRPEEDKLSSKWEDVAAFVDNTVGFVALNALAFASLHAVGGLWASLRTRAGNVGRRFHEWATNTTRPRSSMSGALESIADWGGKTFNALYRFESQAILSVHRLFAPIYRGLGGAAGDRFMADMEEIYGRGKAPDWIDPVTGQRHQGRQLDRYIERRRAVNRAHRELNRNHIFGFLTSWLELPEEPGFKQGYRERMSGRWEQAKGIFAWARGRHAEARSHFDAADQHFVQSRRMLENARLGQASLGQGGMGPGGRIRARAFRGLVLGVGVSYAISEWANAGRSTLKAQVAAENDISDQLGVNTVMDAGYFMPQNAGEVLHSAFYGITRAVAWLGLGLTGRNADELLTVRMDAGGHRPFGHRYHAGAEEFTGLFGAPLSFVRYWVDKVAAMNRNLAVELQAGREDVALKMVTKPMAAGMQMTELFRQMDENIAKLPAHMQDRARAVVDYRLALARQFAGQRDDAEITTRSSMGVRLGDLRQFGFWFGQVQVGDKKTFMGSVVLPAQFAGGLGFQLPFYYSGIRGRDQFDRWYNESMNTSTPLDDAFAGLINATGGEEGWAAGIAKGIMGIGFEPGVATEAAMRSAISGMALIGVGTTLAGMAGSAYLANRMAAARTGESFVTRMQNYYRHGVKPGVSPYMLDNIGYMLQGASQGQMNKFLRGATWLAGFAFRLPGIAIEGVLTAPVRAAGWFGGSLIGESTMRAMGISWSYRSSRIAQYGRVARTGVRGVLFAGLAYMAASWSNARRMGDTDNNAFHSQLLNARNQMERFPVVGGIMASLFKRLVNERDVFANDPYADFRFSAGPTDSYRAELNPLHGKYQPGLTGNVQAFIDSLRSLWRAGSVEGFQTTEFSAGSGLNVSFGKTADKHVANINQSNFRFGVGPVTVTKSDGMTIALSANDGTIDMQLAMATMGSAPLNQHMTVDKRPGFMGKMFLASSPVYEASPALKIAISQRFNMSRYALAAWPAEVQWHTGGFHHGPSRQEKMLTYTATRLTEEGRVLGQFSYQADTFRQAQEAFAEVMTRVAEKTGAGSLDSIMNIFRARKNAATGGSYREEVSDDYEAFMGPPMAPSRPTLRSPLRPQNEQEFLANWWQGEAAQTAGPVMAALFGALGAVSLVGLGLRGVQTIRDFNTLEGRVNRHQSVHRARVRGVMLTPVTHAGQRGLSPTEAGMYDVELDLGRGRVMRVADHTGTPFTHTYSPHVPDTIIMSGRAKAVHYAQAFETVAEVYRSLPEVRSQHGLQLRINMLEEVLDENLRIVNPTGGFTDSPLRQDLFNRLAQLNAQVASGAIGQSDALDQLERITREIQHRFPEVAGLRVTNLGRVQQALGAVGIRGVGNLVMNAIASFGLDERYAPANMHGGIPRRGTGADPRLQSNDLSEAAARTNASWALARQQVGPRLVSRAWEITKRSATGFLKGLQFANNWIFTPFAAVEVLGGLAAAGSESLTDEQKSIYTRHAGYHGWTLAGMGVSLGSAAAGRAISSYATRRSAQIAAQVAAGQAVGRTAGLAGAHFAAGSIPLLGFFVDLGLIAFTWVGTLAEGKHESERNDFERAAIKMNNAMGEWILGVGTALSRIPGMAGVQTRISDWHVDMKVGAVNALFAAADYLKPKSAWEEPSWVQQGLETLALSIGAPLIEANPEVLNRIGQSFSIAPLWQAKSPIWWGPNRRPILWTRDWWESIGKVEQEALRISADPIGSSIYTMVAKETMGIESGSNDDPMNLNFKALYQQKGRGTGGFGNVQGSRAFKYRAVPSVDRIISEELKRRAILYEVGVLGGVLHRAGHKGGGFLGGGWTKDHGGPGPGGFRVATKKQVADAIRSLWDPRVGPADPPKEYSGFISRASAKTGVPEAVIRSVMKIETGGVNYNPSAVSRAGAVGLMQIMPEDWNKDGKLNLRDPETNIMKGAEILATYRRELRQKTGKEPTWEMVAAAYNAGVHGVLNKNAMTEYRETRRYVEKFRAYMAESRVDPRRKQVYDQAMAMSESLDSKYQGNLDLMFEKGLGFTPEEAKRQADLVRDVLYNEGLWLPKDDPSHWQQLNYKIGNVVSERDKAVFLAEAMGRGPRGKTFRYQDSSLLTAQGYKAYLTSTYGEQRRTHRHGGLDIQYQDMATGSPVNAPVLARDSGRVVYAGRAGGYGTLVVVEVGKTEAGKPILEMYGHGSKLLVQTGDTIQRGQTIILQGNEGRSSGYHLHFEVRVGENWRNAKTVDPELVERLFPLGDTGVGDPANDQLLADIEKNLRKYRGDVAAYLRAEQGMTAEKARQVADRYERIMANTGNSLVRNYDEHGNPTYNYFRRFMWDSGIADGYPEDRENQVGWLPALITGASVGVQAFMAYKLWKRRKTATTQAPAQQTVLPPAPKPTSKPQPIFIRNTVSGHTIRVQIPVTPQVASWASRAFTGVPIPINVGGATAGGDVTAAPRVSLSVQPDGTTAVRRVRVPASASGGATGGVLWRNAGPDADLRAAERLEAERTANLAERTAPTLDEILAQDRASIGDHGSRVTPENIYRLVPYGPGGRTLTFVGARTLNAGGRAVSRQVWFLDQDGMPFKHVMTTFSDVLNFRRARLDGLRRYGAEILPPAIPTPEVPRTAPVPPNVPEAPEPAKVSGRTYSRGSGLSIKSVRTVPVPEPVGTSALPLPRLERTMSVVGVQYYVNQLDDLKIGGKVRVLHDPRGQVTGTKHDDVSALAVFTEEGRHIGFLPRKQARQWGLEVASGMVTIEGSLVRVQAPTGKRKSPKVEFRAVIVQNEGHPFQPKPDMLTQSVETASRVSAPTTPEELFQRVLTDPTILGVDRTFADSIGPYPEDYTGERSLGRYSWHKSQIWLRDDVLDVMTKGLAGRFDEIPQKGPYEGRTRFLHTLHTLVHEMVHASYRGEQARIQAEEPWYIAGDERSSTRAALEEGYTEAVARRKTREVMARLGLIEKFPELADIKMSARAYEHFVDLAETTGRLVAIGGKQSADDFIERMAFETDPTRRASAFGGHLAEGHDLSHVRMYTVKINGKKVQIRSASAQAAFALGETAEVMWDEYQAEKKRKAQGSESSFETQRTIGENPRVQAFERRVLGILDLHKRAIASARAGSITNRVGGPRPGAVVDEVIARTAPKQSLRSGKYASWAVPETALTLDLLKQIDPTTSEVPVDLRVTKEGHIIPAYPGPSRSAVVQDLSQDGQALKGARRFGPAARSAMGPARAATVPMSYPVQVGSPDLKPTPEGLSSRVLDEWGVTYKGVYQSATRYQDYIENMIAKQVASEISALRDLARTEKKLLRNESARAELAARKSQLQPQNVTSLLPVKQTALIMDVPLMFPPRQGYIPELPPIPLGPVPEVISRSGYTRGTTRYIGARGGLLDFHRSMTNRVEAGGWIKPYYSYDTGGYDSIDPTQLTRRETYQAYRFFRRQGGAAVMPLIGTGAEASVFDLGNDKVGRVAFGSKPLAPLPASDQINPLLSFTTIENPSRPTMSLMKLSTAPKLVPADESTEAARKKADRIANRIKKQLRSQGIDFLDAHGGNIGWDPVTGTWKVIDPGAVDILSPDDTDLVQWERTSRVRPAGGAPESLVLVGSDTALPAQVMRTDRVHIDSRLTPVRSPATTQQVLLLGPGPKVAGLLGPGPEVAGLLDLSRVAPIVSDAEVVAAIQAREVAQAAEGFTVKAKAGGLAALLRAYNEAQVGAPVQEPIRAPKTAPAPSRTLLLDSGVPITGLLPAGQPVPARVAPPAVIEVTGVPIAGLLAEPTAVRVKTKRGRTNTVQTPEVIALGPVPERSAPVRRPLKGKNFRRTLDRTEQADLRPQVEAVGRAVGEALTPVATRYTQMARLGGAGLGAGMTLYGATVLLDANATAEQKKYAAAHTGVGVIQASADFASLSSKLMASARFAGVARGAHPVITAASFGVDAYRLEKGETIESRREGGYGLVVSTVALAGGAAGAKAGAAAGAAIGALFGGVGAAPGAAIGVVVGGVVGGLLAVGASMIADAKSGGKVSRVVGGAVVEGYDTAKEIVQGKWAPLNVRSYLDYMDLRVGADKLTPRKVRTEEVLSRREMSDFRNFLNAVRELPISQTKVGRHGDRDTVIWKGGPNPLGDRDWGQFVGRFTAKVVKIEGKEFYHIVDKFETNMRAEKLSNHRAGLAATMIEGKQIYKEQITNPDLMRQYVFGGKGGLIDEAKYMVRALVTKPNDAITYMAAMSMGYYTEGIFYHNLLVSVNPEDQYGVSRTAIEKVRNKASEEKIPLRSKVQPDMDDGVYLWKPSMGYTIENFRAEEKLKGRVYKTNDELRAAYAKVKPDAPELVYWHKQQAHAGKIEPASGSVAAQPASAKQETKGWSLSFQLPWAKPKQVAKEELPQGWHAPMALKPEKTKVITVGQPDAPVKAGATDNAPAKQTASKQVVRVVKGKAIVAQVPVEQVKRDNAPVPGNKEIRRS